MKPFNLTEYLANPREVVTRDGRKVRILCTDFSDEYSPIVGAIEGHNTPETFSVEGRYYFGAMSNMDLFFAPKNREGWINIYPESVYNTEKDAIKNRNTGAVATVKLEWEE